jgi:Rrf2 family protein
MLALTKKTDYALIALSQLARRPGALLSAREVAGATRVPLSVLMNILKTLAGAGIIISERGVRGGYRLARPADSISLFELIGAVEGPFHLVQCIGSEHGNGRHSCDLEPCCSIRAPALRVHDRMSEFLRGVTLAELVEEQAAPVQIRPMELGASSKKRGAYKELA